MTRRLLLPLLSLSLLSLASELHAESSDSLQRRPVLIRRAVKKQTPAEPLKKEPLKKEAQQHTPARKDTTPSSPSSPSPAPSATAQTPSSTDSVRRTIQLRKVYIDDRLRPKKIRKKDIGREELTERDIARQFILQTKDFVRYLPGIGLSESVSRYGNKGFAIRGVDENRVSISVDGLPQPETETNVVFSSYGLINSARPQFETEFIKKVDIKKGASSFEHGTGALGGAVNFETKEARSMISPGRSLGLQAKVGGDNMAQGRVYSVGGAAVLGGLEAMALYAHRTGGETRNFGSGPLVRSIFATRPDPLSYRQQSFLGKLAYRLGEHKLTASYYTQNKVTDTEVWSLEPAYVLTSQHEPYYYGHDQVLSRRWDLNYRYTPLESSWLNEVNVYANTQTSYLDADTRSSLYRPEISSFRPNYLFAGSRRLLKGMSFDDQALSLKATTKPLNFGALGYHFFTLQTSYLHHHTEDKNVDISRSINTYSEGLRYKGRTYTFGEELPPSSYVYSFQRPANRDNFSLLVSDRISRGRLRLELGLRYDFFHSETLDWKGDNDFNYLGYLIGNLKTAGMDFDRASIREWGLTPMAIVSYDVAPELSVGYKFSTGYRVPTSQERFFQYVSLSPAFFVLSNPQLRREQSFNHEWHVGTAQPKAFAYDLSFYYNTYRDYIEPLYGVQKVFLDGQNRDVAYSINENKKRAWLWGIDFSSSVYLEELLPQLRRYGSLALSSSLSYSVGRFSDGTSMMAIQPLKAVAGLDFDLPKEKGGLSLRVNFLKAKDVDQTRFVGSFYGDEQIQQFPYYLMQNHVTVDLFAYAQLSRWLTLRASVMNLTNARYWLWDDLRQIISPVMLVHHADFFRGGLERLVRFSQPKRYVNLALEFKL